MKLRGRHVIFSLVLFVFGFLITFSYQQTKNFTQPNELDEQEWERDFFYRQQLIQFEDKNNQLQREIDQKRQDILRLERQLSAEAEEIEIAVDKKTKLQLITGELPIQGPGLFVTVRDSEYIPSEENVNQYIVHDRHIQLIINEMYSAGAEAIAINGQRIFSDSYVYCVGPVISVDGIQYPAPFTIEAIGDPDTLQESLEMPSGVIDILLNDQIEVEVGKKQTIEMGARIG
ncbi:uncharacterized protein YlxW (UPF0749 family) [Natronobacillus azotifigens]|uniref:DUF881 domain-containing protein n=1 Tax=Natronobacillus azotifigens TaxID=472978 RepID=A0A9J6RDE4_9BACI|nr:DUF881 domain-containing protein [Natronobacillus azotifigens]MCZ0703340.1 DUF881 domain-containing protein [Natronobacillus azotifigens]